MRRRTARPTISRLQVTGLVIFIPLITLTGLSPSLRAQEPLPVLETQAAPFAGRSSIRGMAEGPDGTLYVMGTTPAFGVCHVTKLNRNGGVIFRQEFSVGPFTRCGAFIGSIAVDGAGAAYVPVTEIRSRFAFVAKVGSGGVSTQLLPFPGPSFSPLATGVAFDRTRGLLYVSEDFRNPENGLVNVLVAAFTPGLVLVRTQIQRFAPTPDAFFGVSSEGGISADLAGNAYVGTMEGQGFPKPLNYLVLKYGPALARKEWEARTAAPLLGSEQALTAIPAGGAYLASQEEPFPTFRLRRVSPAGAFDLAVGVPLEQAFDTAVAVDLQGNAYLPGIAAGFTARAVKFTRTGALAWSLPIVLRPPLAARSAEQVAASADGALFVAGSLRPVINQVDFLYFARYRQAVAPPPPPPADTTPPARVEDLRVIAASTGSLTLRWTAPGDDGNTGTATSYDVRFRTDMPILTDGDFATATQAAGEPAPQPAGSQETFTAGGLPPGTTHFFALKARDEAGNVSVLSNSPSGRTLPLVRIFLDPESVRPTATAQITVVLVDGFGNPVLEQRSVTLAASTIAFSGGHDHDAGRPSGTISGAGLIFSSPAQGTTGIDGVLLATYTATEFGGLERVIVSLTEAPGVSASATLEVRERDGAGRVFALLPASPAVYIKDGGTKEHHGPGCTEEPGCDAPDQNHFCRPLVVSTITAIALEWQETHPQLEFNDMALSHGGAFDICGTWNTAAVCVNAPQGGHAAHKLGRDVDMQVFPNLNPSSLPQVNQTQLKRLIKRIGGEMTGIGEYVGIRAHWHVNFNAF